MEVFPDLKSAVEDTVNAQRWDDSYVICYEDDNGVISKDQWEPIAKAYLDIIDSDEEIERAKLKVERYRVKILRPDQESDGSRSHDWAFLRSYFDLDSAKTEANIWSKRLGADRVRIDKY